MPGVEDWLRRPLDIVQNLFDHHGNLEVSNFTQYFKDKIQTAETLAKIPLLNCVPVHELTPGCLVRYRCMVQDMFDPEYFVGSYEVANLKSNTRSMRSGLYKDVAECGPNEEIDIHSEKNKTLDRQPLYCVPIPGETDWVKASSQCLREPRQSTSQSGCRRKRSCDDEETSPASSSAPDTAGDATMEVQEADCTGESAEAKRNRREPVSGSAAGAEMNGAAAAATAGSLELNFPLPGETGPACLVKVYEDCDLKLNEMVEFIGILSVDPAMADFSEHDRPGPLQPVDMESAEEKQARSPPPSLVPRLHALMHQRLTLNNPLVPALPGGPDFTEGLAGMEEAGRLRGSLCSVLEHACLGDALAAEYLLCHLISRVKKNEAMCSLVGRMSLNLTQVPTPSPFCSLLHRLVEGLVTQCHLFPLTVANLNDWVLVPKKDYSSNRLRSGVLQLPANMHLIVDETVMQPGQLDSKGLQNFKALEELVTWQKVTYDFQFHRQEFDAHVNVLVLSEGCSMLPKDFQVPIVKSAAPGNMEEYFRQLDSGLTSQLLNELRRYLSLTRYATYSVPEDMLKIIQDDFVELRKDKRTYITEEDFHRMLTLLSYLTTSEWKAHPTPELWMKVKAMEQERKGRCQPRPAQS